MMIMSRTPPSCFLHYLAVLIDYYYGAYVHVGVCKATQPIVSPILNSSPRILGDDFFWTSERK